MLGATLFTSSTEYVKYYNKLILDQISRKYQVIGGVITRVNGDDRYSVKFNGSGSGIPAMNNVKAPSGVKYKIGDNVLVQFPSGNKQIPRIIGLSDLSMGVETVYEFGEPGEDPYCFVAGTLIDTINGKIPIERIKKDFYIFGYNEKLNKIVVNKVEKLIVHDKPYELIYKYYNITTKKSFVKVTGNHLFYIGNNQYKKIEELNINDCLYIYKFNTIEQDKIIKKELINIKIPIATYNLELNGTHNYYANNFLVHNIKAWD